MKNNKPTKRHTLLTKNKDFTEFRDADKIISYLENPDSPTQLSIKLRKQLDRYVEVNKLKMRYKTNSFIVGILKELYGRNERQARYDIAETEYVFGKVVKINIAFEKAFLIEASRKSIELAFISKDVNKISKALEVHNKIIGEEVDNSLLPDFSKFIPNQYNIVMPTQIIQLIQDMSKQGAINLSEIIPTKMVERTMSDAEDAKIIAEDE
jgi:hypothetical protein